MANERPSDQQNDLADDDDDFDFGGFEAADPGPAVEGMPAEAQASPWAAFALGNGQERPDLLCAQNRFPPYLDPSDISGASDGTVNAIINNVYVPPHPNVAADLLGDAHFVEHPVGPEQADILNTNGRLPDLGLGINDGHLFGQLGLNAPVDQASVDGAILVPIAPTRNDGAAAPNGVVPVPVPEVVDAVPENENRDVVQGEEELAEHREEVVLDQGVEHDNNEAERLEVAERLTSLSERNSVLEEELERSRSELESQRSRLQEIEALHSQTLEEVRLAGHDALSVVVEEYKEQIKTVIAEQQAASQQCMVEALREQMDSFQELIQVQKQKHEEEREQDKEEMKKQNERAVDEACGQLQGRFQSFIEEEQGKWRKDMEKAVQEERTACQAEIHKVVDEEQKTAKDRLDQARAEYSNLLEEDRKKQEEALATVRREEAERAREQLATLVGEERERGRESVREALEAARADSRSYINEQRQADSRIRQRHLTSLDLFLESCRQQISMLMEHEQTGNGAMARKLTNTHNSDADTDHSKNAES